MHSLIDERERTLALKAQAAKRKLMAKALLIRRLKQPRAEMSMYFDARRDHFRGSILKSSRLPAFMCHLFSIDAGSQELRCAPLLFFAGPHRSNWLIHSAMVELVCLLARSRRAANYR
jgi:hypothetical protein